MTMMHTTAFLVSLLLSAAADDAVVDLSMDLETASLDNPGAAQITAAASAVPEIRTAIVLERGKIVAEYVRDDVDITKSNQVWSATKSWTSLLFGVMESEGLIGLNDTLGEIFTDDAAWVDANETEVEFKKNVTIYEMLTMTSGLIDPLSSLEDFLAGNYTDGGDMGGGTLAGSLAFPSLGEKGMFKILSVSTILSYIIQEKTGMTPREYAVEKVFPAFGIDDSEIGWWQNQDGVEYAYHGLEVTVIQMAKFGQLYLQGGMSAPNSPLISPEWASNSTSPLVEEAYIGDASNPMFAGKYGYLIWFIDGSSLGFPNAGKFYCAIGFGGQDICVHPELERVSVQQCDWEDGVGNLVMTVVAFDKTVSFDKVENGDMTTGTSGSTCTGKEESPESHPKTEF